MCSQPGQALCEGRDRTLLICSTWVLPWYSGRNLNEDYGGRKEAQLLYLLVACFKRRKPETGHIFTSSVKSSTMKADSGDRVLGWTQGEWTLTLKGWLSGQWQPTHVTTPEPHTNTGKQMLMALGTCPGHRVRTQHPWFPVRCSSYSAYSPNEGFLFVACF